jgi:dihydrodipicolinate synthase/N-acetylneuraminate lyase
MKRYRRTILASCCVPWHADFTFAEEIFRRQVRHMIAQGISDLYIFGTAGEGYAVTDRQFDEITRVFLEETRGEGIQSMVGLISISLPTIVERIERAMAMGARRFQISLPSWGTLRDAEIASFFHETCGRFRDCEFLHYNLIRTGRIIPGAEYGQLAAEYPNLVATKNSTTDEARLQSLMNDAPDLRHFITEPGFPKAARMGECGFLVSIASTNFARAREYFEAGKSGDFTKLDAMQEELMSLAAEMKNAVGDNAHMDGAFDKLFCHLHDDQFPLRLLPPYLGCTPEIFQRFADAVRTRHPRWMPS